MPQPAPHARPEGSWAVACADAARAYMLRVCGPEVAGSAVEHAVGEVLRVAGDGIRPPAAVAARRVRAAIREAALAQAGHPRARSARPRDGCAEVLDLLRRRAAAPLPPAQDAALARRLDRCPDCAELSDRLDAAERQLEAALGGPGAAGPGLKPLPAPIPPRHPRPGAGRPERRRLVALAGALLVLAAALAATQLRGGATHRPALILPIVRRPLARIPVATPGPAFAGIGGVSADELVLGSAPSTGALTPAGGRGIAGAALLG